MFPDALTREVEALNPSADRRVAVLSQSDFVARRLLHHWGSAHPGWRAGEVVGVSGHDNIEPLLGFDAPLLTTVSTDHDRMVEVLVSLLLGAIEGHADAAPQVTLPSEVVFRQSL